MYKNLAHLYDWTGVFDFANEFVPLILDVANRFDIQPPGPIVDLACGTGEIASHLALAGWKLVGVDWSEAMLTVAKQKLDEQGITAMHYVHADIRSFVAEPQVPMVICTYDSINHLLTQSDITQCFESVYASLQPGGIFLFDVNTEQNYTHFWQGKDKDELPNVQLTLNATYDEDKGRAIVSISAAEHRDDELVMLEDEVSEQFYDTATLHLLLEQTGFHIVETRDFSPQALSDQDLILKQVWVCQKPE